MLKKFYKLKELSVCSIIILFLQTTNLLAQAGFFGNPTGGVLSLNVSGGGNQNYRHTETFPNVITSLVLTGGYIHTFKSGTGNICSGTLYYRFYRVGNTPGSYTTLSLPFSANQPFTTNANGGNISTSTAGDQRWGRNDQSVNLLSGLGGGQYTLDFYYEATGATSGGGCGSTFTYGTSGTPFSFNFDVLYSTAAAGNWSSPTTWLGGIVPETGRSASINHNVTLDVNATVSNLTINSGGTFNGSSNTLSLSAGGSITNNGTFTAGTGTINCLGNATLPNGTYYNISTAGILNLSGTATINNNLQINDGGSVTGTSPTYTNTSTLIYNRSNAANYNLTATTLEWTGTGVTVGSGTPQNVTLINTSGTGNFILSFPTSDRGLAGNLTIGGFCTINLNITSGDLRLAGNFTNNGGLTNFNGNGRAVFFEGNNAQTIGGSSATVFSYLIFNKGISPIPSITLGNNISVIATSGSVLQFNGTTTQTINTNGFILTLANSGGNILLSNNAIITNTAAPVAGFPSGLLISGTKNLNNNGTNKILTIGANCGLRLGATLTANPATGTTTEIIISTGGGIDFMGTSNPLSKSGAGTATLTTNSGAFILTAQPILTAMFGGFTNAISTSTDLNFVLSPTGIMVTGAQFPSDVASLTSNNLGTAPNNVISLSNTTLTITTNLVLNAGVLNISGVQTTISGGITRVNGVLQTSNGSTLIISIPNSFSIPNNLFQTSPAPLQDLQVTVGTGNTLSLGNQSLAIDGTVTMTSGVLNLNGNNILLGATGLVSENFSAGHIIRDATATIESGVQGGYIEATGRQVSGATTEIAGLGVFLRTTGGTYNDLTIRRSHYRAGNGAGVRLIYALSSPSIGANPTFIGFRNLNSTENPGSLTLNQIYRWNTSGGWSSILTNTSGCFGSAIICTTNSQTSFSHWTIGENTVPLPISLVKFEGKAINSTQAKLTWQTASEQNNQYFEVEKSLDGQNFEKIITIDGAGNSSVLRNYSVIDNDFKNMAYYRLRQKDFNGASTLSNVIIVKSNTESLLVYPNPTKGEIFIQSNENKDSILRWRLLDMTGKEIISDNQKLENIEKTLSNHLQQQRKGLYLIEIYTNQQVYRQRLLVE